MSGEDIGVVRVEDHSLDGPAEDILRVAHYILVDRCVHCHQHCHRFPVTPAGTARLLKETSERAGVADNHGCVQPAYIYAKLQCGSSAHPDQFTRKKPALDLAALRRQVASPVGSHFIHQVRRGVAQGFDYISINQLRRDLGFGKDDCGDARADQVRSRFVRLDVSAAARPVAALADLRRVPENVCLLAARAAVAINQVHRPAKKLQCDILGVGDGRGAENEYRIRAVMPADSVQPAEEIGGIGAEKAGISVQFIDYDILQAPQELGPAGMLWQEACVKHIGVGENDSGFIAQLSAHVRGGVAVENAGERLWHSRRAQCPPNRLELILRKRLCGVQEDRSGIGPGLQHRN